MCNSYAPPGTPPPHRTELCSVYKAESDHHAGRGAQVPNRGIAPRSTTVSEWRLPDRLIGVVDLARIARASEGVRFGLPPSNTDQAQGGRGAIRTLSTEIVQPLSRRPPRPNGASSSKVTGLRLELSLSAYEALQTTP